MPENRPGPGSTLALNTTVEQDFVSPLTAVRGSLEILRDFPDLTKEDRDRFVHIALSGCARLERGIELLSNSVYAAVDDAHAGSDPEPSPKDLQQYGKRVTMLDDRDILELDMSDLTFKGSAGVNDFFDVVDWVIELSGRSWFILVNVGGCSIWPEAWVAFAHRSKKINVSYSRGTVRYDGTSGGAESADPDLLSSRSDALQRIAALRAES